MAKPHFAVVTILVGLVALSATVVLGQEYPNKPIRIVTSTVGGANDFTARQIAQGVSANLAQRVVVENRGTGLQSAEIVSKALPDGYTLLLASGALWVAPLLLKAPFDAVRDFSPISQIERTVLVVTVHPSMPVKSVKELIALAKAKPGELNYGSGPTGTSTHLAAELFKSMAGVNIVRVPYAGGGAALVDLIGGQVQVAFTTAPSVAQHVKAGRLIALAVTGAEPSALVPGLPTVAATGVPGYESVLISGMFAPAKTPVAIVKRLNQEVVRAVNRADVKERFLNAGVEAFTGSPEEFAVIIKADMAKISKVIKDVGIKAD